MIRCLALVAVCFFTIAPLPRTISASGIEWQFLDFRNFKDSSWPSELGASVVIEVPGQGFIVGGREDNEAGLLVKLSTEGAFVDRRNYLFGTLGFKKVHDLVLLSDGSLVAVGEAEQGGSPELGAAFVFRISRDFELSWWEYIRVQTYKNVARQAILSDEGEIAVAGFSTETDMNDDGSFALLSTEGEIAVAKRYGRFVDETDPNTTHFDDRFFSIGYNSSGQFLLAGTTALVPTGRSTFWLVAVDEAGTMLWQEMFGGDELEEALDLKVLPDGGVILGGYSTSPPGGTKTSPHYGGEDYWVVRLDGERNIVWQRSYGGTGNDRLVSLDVTEDGGFVLGGWSDSPVSGNKTAAHRGKKDYWVIRTDAQGEVLWEETYGGSEDDELVSIEQTSDGGYIIGGNSSSGADGNKTKPETGWWIIKLAAEGAARLSAPAQSAADIAAEGFRMTLSGAPGTSYVLERSADLSEWTPISTNLLTESELELRDPAPGTEMNFYRTLTQFQDGRIE